MSRLRSQAESLYGFPMGIVPQFPSPVIAKRDPTTADTGYSLGREWVNKTSGNIWALGALGAGIATWTLLGSLTSTFTTITATTFTTATAATSITIAGNVFTGVGTNAAVGFTFTPKGAGGLTLTTGPLTLSSGSLRLTLGNLTLTSGNVLLTAGTLTLTLGNATLTNGSLFLGTAGNGISIKSGANARIGQATLVLGTKAIANTSVTANTRFSLTRSSINASTKLGVFEAIGNPGVGFTINSYTPSTGVVEPLDISIVDWILVESA